MFQQAKRELMFVFPPKGALKHKFLLPRGHFDMCFSIIELQGRAVAPPRPLPVHTTDWLCCYFSFFFIHRLHTKFIS